MYRYFVVALFLSIFSYVRFKSSLWLRSSRGKRLRFRCAWLRGRKWTNNIYQTKVNMNFSINLTVNIHTEEQNDTQNIEPINKNTKQIEQTMQIGWVRRWEKHRHQQMQHIQMDSMLLLFYFLSTVGWLLFQLSFVWQEAIKAHWKWIFIYSIATSISHFHLYDIFSWNTNFYTETKMARRNRWNINIVWKPATKKIHIVFGCKQINLISIDRWRYSSFFYEKNVFQINLRIHHNSSII